MRGPENALQKASGTKARRVVFKYAAALNLNYGRSRGCETSSFDAQRQLMINDKL